MVDDPRVEAVAVSMCELKYGEETAYMLVRFDESASVAGAPVDAYDVAEVACHYVWRQFEQRARAALSAADKAAWRPVSEVEPGTWGLFYEPKRQGWGNGHIYMGSRVTDMDHYPTHFMHLPTPPQEEE